LNPLKSGRVARPFLTHWTLKVEQAVEIIFGPITNLKQKPGSDHIPPPGIDGIGHVNPNYATKASKRLPRTPVPSF